MLDTEDRQGIMLDRDASFAFQEDGVIMDASTNVFEVDHNQDDSLQFTDRLRGLHTSEEIMSLKLLKLLRLTGAPHYAYLDQLWIYLQTRLPPKLLLPVQHFVNVIRPLNILQTDSALNSCILPLLQNT
jgi:hypothetical protein